VRSESTPQGVPSRNRAVPVPAVLARKAHMAWHAIGCQIHLDLVQRAAVSQGMRATPASGT